MNQCQLKYSHSNVITNITDLNNSFSLGSLKVAYTGQNYNHTAISKEAFEACAHSMFNCPIVANYDVVSNAIGGHDLETVETDQGLRTINLTEPVGVIPESATYRWESISDNGVLHDYFCVDGVILWKRQPCYSKLAANGITSQSIEIAITGGTMVDGIFNIEEFEFQAFCLLERDEPCFEQASLQVFSKDEFKQQWQQMMQEYSETFKQETSTGGTIVADEMTTDIEIQPEVDPVEDVEVQVDTVETPVDSDPASDEIVEEDIPEEEKFSLTAQQLRQVLQKAIASLQSEDECGRYYVEDWDESEVYVMDYEDCTIYGYAYTVSGDSASIDFNSRKKKKLAYVDVEDGVTESNSALAEVINAIVESSNASLSENYDTQINELNNTISDLNVQVKELAEFKKERLESDRAEAEASLFENFDTQLKGMDEYKLLKENASNYSIEELEIQCYALIGKKNYSFSKDVMTTKKIPVEHETMSVAEDVYGGLLKNKNMI